MERRRKGSAKGSFIVDTQKEASKKPLKLVLKASEDSPPEKRPHVCSSLVECLQLDTPDAVLEQLLQVRGREARRLSANPQRSLAALQDLWRVHYREEHLCAVLARLFLEVVVLPPKRTEEEEEEEEDVGHMKDFALALTKHECPSVKVLAMGCLLQLAKYHRQLVPVAMETAQTEINTINHAVRVECLNVIGQLELEATPKSFEACFAILEEYCIDSDPRVRVAALHALLLKHKQGMKLCHSIYHKASEAIRDNDEDVRTVALQLVRGLALESPETVLSLPLSPPLEVRMCDDAFTKICDLVNDLSMSVRALAARLMGDFHFVSPNLLDQTLDKKLMAHLREVKSEHDRQKALHASGGRASGGRASGWDSGTWGAGIPKLDMDPGQRSLISAGACGAFVHGLEDEFLEVRLAAVSSMCQLGIRCRSFAAQCVDFLVDMFNDEIQSVRLGAINSLRQISATLQLREDQMMTVLSVLEESSIEIREALHSLLSTCQITAIPALQSTIHSLLDNLKKYPSDRESIWRCLQQLGTNHSTLVSCLAPALLSSHPFLMSKEPDADDPAYICILILVFNAAALCPTLPPLFPSHVFRHYAYLRDALPNLIPTIKVGMPSSTVRTLSLPQAHSNQAVAHTFLDQVLTRAQTVLPTISSSSTSSSSTSSSTSSSSTSSSTSSSSTSSSTFSSPNHRQEVLRTCISDLVKVGRLDNHVVDGATCAATLLQCQLLMEEVNEALSRDLLLTSSELRYGPSHTLRAIEEILLLSYRLQTICRGLGAELEGAVRATRVMVHAMLLLLAIQLDMDTELSTQFMELKEALSQRLKNLSSYFKGHDLSLPPTIHQLMDVDFVTIATDSLTQCLKPLATIPLFTSLTPHSLSSVRLSTATIEEPQSSSRDDYKRFVSSLALSLPLQASLNNIPSLDDVRVMLKFPDGRKLLFSPKATDFRPQDVHTVKLNTDVIISHGLWTDPCQVELCIVLYQPTDVPEDSCLSLTSPPLKQRRSGRKTSEGHSLSRFHSNDNSVHSHSQDGMERGHCILAISEVLTVNIFPQETASKSFNVFGVP